MQKITYGFYQSPFGKMIIGKTDKGVCWLGFMVDGYKGNGFDRMKIHFKVAKFTEDQEMADEYGFSLIEAWEKGEENSYPLDIQGTAFQHTVWSALRQIKRGEVNTYSGIAQKIGNKNAVRAVGTAIGENPISLIIPCHRVIQKSGGLGNYGWGVALKTDMLKAEGINA